MRRVAFLALAALAPLAAAAQEASETRELLGRMGRSTAVLVLTSQPRADGDWRVTGEYLLLPSLVRRYLEGERSPQLGVTTLREGNTPIFFGRAPTGTLQGTWREGRFQGARFAPGGQERERFEFAEDFPSMDAYSASVRCEAGDARYASTLAFVVEGGRLKPRSLEWRSSLASSGHSCTIGAGDAFSQAPAQGAQASAHGAQTSAQGALRFTSGKCAVTLRDLGDYVRATADDCASFCGSQAYFEPVLVDKRGGCLLTTPRER